MKPLGPIVGVMKTPLVSLEDAIKNLPIEDIDVYGVNAVDLADGKLRSGNPHKLTVDEVYFYFYIFSTRLS